MDSFMHDGCDENDEAEAEEGFQMLFGGISLTDVSTSAWDCQSESSSSSTTSPSSLPSIRPAGNNTDRGGLPQPEKVTYFECESINGTNMNAQSSTEISSDHHHIFAYAHTNSMTVQRPPVAIVDMSSVVDKGLGLVATRPIAEGEVIFTERAAVATQVPTLQPPRKDSKRSSSRSEEVPQSCLHYPVSACQYCFKSLESIEGCMPATSTTGDDISATALAPGAALGPKTQITSHMPMPELWPVLPLDFMDMDDDDNMDGYQRDRHGRRQCTSCETLFCSDVCKTKFEADFGANAAINSQNKASPIRNSRLAGCCALSTVIKQYLQLVEGTSEPQVNVILAVRLLAKDLQRLRKESTLEKPSEVGDNAKTLRTTHFQENKTCWTGLCGNADDINKLELGIAYRNSHDLTEHVSSALHESSVVDETLAYTLQPVYDICRHTWSMNDMEQHILDVPHLHRLASICARNGIGMLTQSPFKTYYSSLIRAAGRGTRRHTQVMQQVACALLHGSSATNNNTGGGAFLQRGMDRLVESRVAPELGGIFPLTARMNHSCDPVAQVRSQVFVDCYIDVVALRPIDRGEEITISYISLGTSNQKKGTVKRQRELACKYLFQCQCVLCSSNSR